MHHISAEGLQIEELPQAYQDVARLFGMEMALGFSKHFGGLSVYFPKIENLLRKKRDENICKEFDGSNYRELARKYELCEVHIREIANKARNDKKARGNDER